MNIFLKKLAIRLTEDGGNNLGLKYYSLIKVALVNEDGMNEKQAVEYLDACKNR